MKFYGILQNPSKSYEILWNPMESYEILWNPMESYEILWNLTGSHEILWNPMRSYGILWILCNPMEFKSYGIHGQGSSVFRSELPKGIVRILRGYYAEATFDTEVMFA